MSNPSTPNNKFINPNTALSDMLVDAEQARRVAGIPPEDFAQHMSGDLPDRTRVMRADMVGIATTKLTERNRQRITETQKANGVGVVGRLVTRASQWRADTRLGKTGEVIPGITSAEITDRIRRSTPLIPTQAEPEHDVIERPKGAGVEGQPLGSIEARNSAQDAAEAAVLAPIAKEARDIKLIQEMNPPGDDFLQPPQSPAQVALGRIARPFKH